MTDLAAQLRDYIDGIAEPIPLVEATRIAELSVEAPRRSRRTAAVLIATVAVIALMVVGGTLVWSSSDESTIATAHAPGTALAARGPADCSAVRTPSDTLLVATTLTNGHTICITETPNSTTVYLDGHNGLGSSGQPVRPTGSIFGGVGLVRGRLIMVGNMPDDAHAMRITFCNGQSLDLLPINSNPPRFVAASIATKRAGLYRSVQPIDSTGQRIGHASGPGRAACAPPHHQSQIRPATGR